MRYNLLILSKYVWCLIVLTCVKNGLENQRGFTPTVGSNPTLSAIFRDVTSPRSALYSLLCCLVSLHVYVAAGQAPMCTLWSSQNLTFSERRA